MTVLLDISVPVTALRFAAVSAPPDLVDRVCAAQPATLSGLILCSRLLRLDVTGGRNAALARCAPISVTQGLATRGSILLGGHGRIGVSIGAGRVIEPYGRSFALCAATADRWVSAWWPPTVLLTMGGS